MKPTLKKHYRFLVIYEDCTDPENVKTFQVWSATASEALSRTINFINYNKLHTVESGYTLTPRISKQEADYKIN